MATLYALSQNSSNSALHSHMLLLMWHTVTDHVQNINLKFLFKSLIFEMDIDHTVLCLYMLITTTTIMVSQILMTVVGQALGVK